MFILKSLNKFGEYILLMGKVFSIPDRWSEFFRRYIMEVYQLVIDSIAIVVTISLFIGAVIAIQTSLNIMSPLIPPYTVGLITRDTLLLEFSSSIMCLILAGKIGSNIASEIWDNACNRTDRRTGYHGGKLRPIISSYLKSRH